ncbi:MAG TPA: ABC transporter permease, partial [Acidimicrobiales bacterium]|nr:ABC transporter permease [Acidimicrobiales bacterium]
EHMTMSVEVVLAAIVVALPFALWLGHIGKGGYAAISLANAGRAIPSFGLLVIGFEIFGLGSIPVFLALFALSVPPIVTNTYVGVRQVDPDMTQAAEGMGMTGLQMLTRVEFPAAIPLIFAGIRTAGVQTVATATIGAVVGWGGLGRYIIDGNAQQDHVQVFAGALLVALVAFLTELALAALQRAVTPTGLRLTEGQARRTSALPGAAAPIERQAA